MDLSTNYMGLQLRSPLVVSACPLSKNLDTLRKMEDAGAGAVTLWSLFEEQILHDADEIPSTVLDLDLDCRALGFEASTGTYLFVGTDPHIAERTDDTHRVSRALLHPAAATAALWGHARQPSCLRQSGFGTSQAGGPRLRFSSRSRRPRMARARVGWVPEPHAA